MSVTPARIVLTGASGLVGKRLRTALLGEGCELRLISRSARESAEPRERWYTWDDLDAALDGAEAVVNLAGAPVAGRRWTRAVREELRTSRVDLTQDLVAAMGRGTAPPKVLVQASAVGFYGDRGDEELTEESTPGSGFLSELCVDWEAAGRGAEAHGTRVVLLRTGLVLDPDGGALGKMLPIFKLGLGGRLGNGQQWMPWIHRDDEVGLIVAALREEAFHGPINACARQPVRNVDFTRALGAALNRPTLFPAPAFALRALFGDGADVLLGGQRALPEAALRHGWAPQYADLPAALADLLG